MNNDNATANPSAASDVDDVIAEFICAEETGNPINESTVLEQYPQYADELKQFFDDRQKFQRLAAPLPAAPQSFSRAGRSFGDYELIEDIAHGGMGVVYKARQKSLNRTVAVKMILTGHLASEDDIRRFHTEAEAAANLQHPNIVAVYEVGVHDGHHYFSMDYVKGTSLDKVIAEKLPGVRHAVKYVRDIAIAVDSAHQQGILHRDIKPSNVLIDQQDEVRITDFGLAIRVEDQSGLTHTGQIVGTPSYMSPEQAKSQRDLIGPKSDVYSIGVILYELLTGRPPFRADSAIETIQQVIDLEPPPPRLLNPAIPRDLETICLKCLEKEPDKRYPSAQALANDLERFLDHQPILARPITRTARLWKLCRRRPALAALVVSSAVAALALVGVGVSLSYSSRLEASYDREAGLRKQKEKALAVAVEAKDKLQKLNTDLHSLNGQLKEETAKKETALASAVTAKNELEELNTDLESLNTELKDETAQKTAALNEAEMLAYVLRIQTARRAWQANDVKRAENLLAECPERLRGFEWNYLKWMWKLYEARIHLGAKAESFATNPDGSLVAIITNEGRLALIETASRSLVRSFAPRDDHTTCVAFNSQNNLLVGRADGTIDLLDLPQGNLLKTFTLTAHLEPHLSRSQKAITVPITSIACAGNRPGFAVTFKIPYYRPKNSKRGVRLPSQAAYWSGDSPEPKFIIEEATDRLALSPGGISLATVSGNSLRDNDPYPSRTTGGIRIWDTQKGAIDYVLAEDSDKLPVALSLDFSPSGTLLATGHSDSTVRIWELRKRKAAVVSSEHAGPVWDVDFAADEHVVSASADGTARLWNWTDPAKSKTFRGHYADVRYAALSPGGERLVTLADDESILLWNPRQELRSKRLDDKKGRRPWITVDFHPTGKQLCYCSTRGGGYLVDLQTGKITEIKRTKQIRQFGPSLAYSPVGDQIAVGGRGGRLAVYDLDLGQFVRHFDATRRGYSSRISYSPDGSLVTVATANGLLIGDVTTGASEEIPIPGEFDARMGGISATRFSPDGSLIACSSNARSSEPGCVDIYDRFTGQRVRRLDGPETGMWDMCFSPDGRRIAGAVCSHVGRRPGEVYVWDVESGEVIFRLQGFRYGVWSVAFSPDGSRLAAGAGVWAPGPDQGAELKIFDMTYGQEVLDLEGHTGAVMSVDFGPGGDKLASAAADWTVRLWEATPHTPNEVRLKLPAEPKPGARTLGTRRPPAPPLPIDSRKRNPPSQPTAPPSSRTKPPPYRTAK